MKIWIINPYGNIPGEGWKLHRSYMIAEALSVRGYDVSYWISNVDHRSKRIRSERYCEKRFGENLTIKIVPTNSYTEHISLKRIKSEATFIRNLRKKSLEEKDSPDFIIVGEPALFISLTVTKLVRKFKAKLLIDFIDIWPELFVIALPEFLISFNKIIFAPLYWKRAWFVKKADAIVSVSEAYMKIAKRYNNSVPSRVIYWGVDLNEFSKPASDFKLSGLNLPPKKDNELWIIYAGTLGDNYDVRTIMNFARIIDKSELKIKLIIAGDGNLKEFILNSVSCLSSSKTYFIGRVASEDLNELYNFCDVSLSTYVPGSTVSMPIKAFDYFAAGLPLINSLGMDLKYFVEEKLTGLQYEPGNPEDMFSKVKILYNDRELLSKMKKNCKDLARIFDQKDLYMDYVAFVSGVI